MLQQKRNDISKEEVGKLEEVFFGRWLQSEGNILRTRLSTGEIPFISKRKLFKVCSLRGQGKF